MLPDSARDIADGVYPVFSGGTLAFVANVQVAGIQETRFLAKSKGPYLKVGAASTLPLVRSDFCPIFQVRGPKPIDVENLKTLHE
jgi:hypothetical protein